MTINWKLLWEAIKEPLRWFALSVVAYIVTLLLGQVEPIANFLYEWVGLNQATWIAGLTMILRAADKYLYKIQKANAEAKGEEQTRFGLTQF